MAVLPEDLMAPGGLIELFMFPGEDADNVAVRLQSFINEAEGRSSPSDAATRSWAYYRAFSAVTLRLSALPQQVEVTDEGGHSYGSQQVGRIKQMADEQLAEWEAYLAEAAERPVGRARGAAPNRYVW